jgi:hypothetical protein
MEDGYGVRIDKTGTRYEGTFKQGKKEGKFKETDSAGNERTINYRNDRLVSQ